MYVPPLIVFHFDKVNSFSIASTPSTPRSSPYPDHAYCLICLERTLECTLSALFAFLDESFTNGWPGPGHFTLQLSSILIRTRLQSLITRVSVVGWMMESFNSHRIMECDPHCSTPLKMNDSSGVATVAELSARSRLLARPATPSSSSLSLPSRASLFSRLLVRHGGRRRESSLSGIVIQNDST